MTQISPLPNESGHASITNVACEPPAKKAFKRTTKLSPADQVLLTVGQRLAEARKEDNCDVFAKNVGAKLRSLSKDQRLYAERVINETVFEAELGNLSRYARVNTGTLSESSSSRTSSVAYHDYQQDQRQDEYSLFNFGTFNNQ